MNRLSQHPYDWLIHFGLCFAAIYFNSASVIAVIFVAVMLEYEQKTQVGYNELSWKDYFLRHSLGDLIADGLGIITGLMLDFWPSGKPEEDKETKDFSDMTDFEELGMSYHKT